MDEHSPKRGDQRPESGAARLGGDSVDAEESLSEALSGLERILVQRQRRGRPDARPRPREATPRPASDDAQYTIPMLNDVVVPGGDTPPAPASGGGDVQPASPYPEGEGEAEEEELCRRLTERLANEIEVLIQARIETAVQEAAGDLREQVRNHLEIMLPEILEELNALGRRRRG